MDSDIQNAPLHDQWFYVDANGQTYGPATSAELQNLVNSGAITSETPVARNGDAEWRKYAEVAKEAFNPTPPPIPSIVFSFGTSQKFTKAVNYAWGRLKEIMGHWGPIAAKHLAYWGSVIPPRLACVATGVWKGLQKAYSRFPKCTVMVGVLLIVALLTVRAFPFHSRMTKVKPESLLYDSRETRASVTTAYDSGNKETFKEVFRRLNAEGRIKRLQIRKNEIGAKVIEEDKPMRLTRIEFGSDAPAKPSRRWWIETRDLLPFDDKTDSSLTTSTPKQASQGKTAGQHSKFSLWDSNNLTPITVGVIVCFFICLAVWKSEGSQKGKHGCMLVTVSVGLLIMAGVIASNSGPKPAPSSGNTAPISSPSYPELPTYQIVRTNDSGVSTKIVYDVRVDYINGRFPSREHIAKIAGKIRNKADNYERVFICFCLPDMFLDAGAFATANYTPKLSISYEPDQIPYTLISNWLAGFREKYGRSFGDDPGVNRLFDEYNAKVAGCAAPDQERLTREFYRQLKREIEGGAGDTKQTKAKSAPYREPQDWDEFGMDEDELREKDRAEQIRQRKRYWENPDDSSILRNLDRKDREFWGTPSRHR